MQRDRRRLVDCSGYAEPATGGANPGFSVVSVTIECQTPPDTSGE
jgi:hypothetical protein